MDTITNLENGTNAILAITKSTNKHILGFYYNGEDVDSHWTLRNENENVLKQETVSLLQKTAMNLTLTPDDKGRLEVSFGISINDDRKLYLVQSPDHFKHKYSVVFKKDQDIVCLKEIYVEFGAQTTCFCRCENIKTREEFAEHIAVDLGPFAYLM